MLRAATTLFFFTCLFLFTSFQEQPIYKNPAAPVEARVRDLLGRMTLEEKVAQTLCIWQQKGKLILTADGQFDAAKARKNLPNGVGQIGRPSEGPKGGGGKDGKNAREMAEFTNAVQRYFVEETRLGIPVIFHEECLHGHAAQDGTHFPQPIALAGTWDEDLIQRLFTMTADEASSRGASQALTPVVDVARDPRWGRFEETYGEDPYLVSRMGVAAVKGFQGDTLPIGDKHLIATLKHMTGHGQPESGMNVGPASISRRVLREVFFPPFETAVQEANALSVMASYNEIDGVPSHMNRWLLQDVLRDEWGFEGYVVADYEAIMQLEKIHHVAKDSTEAARKAIEAGVDIELPDPYAYASLLPLVKSGQLPEAVLDSSVARLLRGKFLVGLFDNPYVDPDYAERIVGSAEHAALAKEAALKSITLLKNNGLLPLDASQYQNIAIIGPNADAVLLGGYSDEPKYFITVREGLQNKLGDQVTLRYAEGCRITEPGSWYQDPVQLPNPQEEQQRMQEAEAVARQSDVIILAIGGNELTSREAWSPTHMGDRTNLQMVGNQLELYQRLQATGKPIVVLLFNGRPLAVNEVAETAPALLECWYLGQESGNAVADVLFGDYNPSAKLAATVPRSVGHLPAYYNYKPSARRGYLFDEVSPLYPFGFGLSYTTYDYKNLRLAKKQIGKNESVTVSVEVTNSGDRTGEEIVQMYLHDQVSSITRRVQELKGFAKVSLAPGETKTVTLEITPEKLAFYNYDMEKVVEPGLFDVMVGPSSAKYDTVELEVIE